MRPSDDGATVLRNRAVTNKETIRRLGLEQCAKCRMLGCDRGPGFADLAFRAPSMWRCQCRCHPINQSEAAQFLSAHLAKNHTVTTTNEGPVGVGVFNGATLTCTCGDVVNYDSGDNSIWVPEYDREAL